MNSQFINRSVTPVLVWTDKNPDEETREQVIANHERFRTLPPEAKYKLGFQHTPEIIKKTGEDFNLDPLKMASIARAVRSFYFGDLPKEKIEGFLMEEMEISSEQAQKIASIVVQKIINAPIPKDVSEQKVEIPLLDALAKYQRLSEQTVTEGRIVVKGESQPVRGSIRNWVRHYRDMVGIRKHTAMERGQFLFQGENTKRLDAPERERLSLLFRSLDENMPISIDTERQEVIFPLSEGTAPAPSTQGGAQTASMIGTSFRPFEKFPAQSAPFRKALEWEKKEEQEDKKNAPLFGRTPESPQPVMSKPGIFGSSAPVYSNAPETPPPSPELATPGTMSFSSSHVLPHEKEMVQRVEHINRPPAPPRPEAISVIKPRGNHFGFRNSDEGGGNA